MALNAMAMYCHKCNGTRCSLVVILADSSILVYYTWCVNAMIPLK